ncbi:DEAD/DEAH box helicase family protein [uncultured Tenacibaculum sp.]|uniref:DEAD/DEAH box helicase family protein n=1 Tax=uncultured Tenacibaculum sp. TaxID=174713 RepID=UPI00261AB12A|nr:DEAD/DEAH box helicase family protein [uncultured Tenacibaculum sp.]
MKTSLQKLHFKLQWRAYQAKVLENFDKHIEDNHFHIVAPPGSGKTILGLEIVRRIGKKTLILAPTLTIRNQWNDRLQSFFTTTDESFDEISFDIKNPSTLTFATYQALYSFFKTFETIEEYFDFFKKEQIEVLLLDEAHHLKNAWWKCLYDLKEEHLQTVVALTATPPYDSENTEIQKYFKLCNEIDDEIVVPDLVKEKNLAPHQDLVYLSKPEDDEIKFITEFKKKVSDFITELTNDSEFIDFVKKHRFYSFTANNLEEIYKQTEFFSSILIFLNATGEKITREKSVVFGFHEEETIEFPEFNNHWAEILLQFLLVTDREQLLTDEEYLEQIEKQLRLLSTFSKNKVNLTGDELVYKSLSNSPSKLNSIVEIVRQEQKNLKDDLRCVILTDYIRKEYLNTEKEAHNEIQKMGVIPIFQRIKNVIFYPKSLAVLTGSIVIVHQDIINELEKIDNLENYTITYLKSDENFVLLTAKTSSQKSIVEVITALFQLGHIKILIGTKSLLGEGWDAPSINSLILASVVGSFVSSNQMRGRAIRIDSDNPNKVGLIWHLACLDPTNENGGKDFTVLDRRFSSFLGISNTENNTIKTGIKRLNLPEAIFPNDVESLNQKTLALSGTRSSISEKWEKAIFKGKKVNQQLTFINRSKKKLEPKGEDYTNAVVFAVKETWFILLLFAIYGALLLIINHKPTLYFLSFTLLLIVIWFAFKINLFVKYYLKYGIIDKRIYNRALVVLNSLYDLQLISTPKHKVKLKTKVTEKGNIVCTIDGANRLESKLFVDALNELLIPIENPKYIICESTWLTEKLEQQRFFAVPEVFCSNKKSATVFEKYWNKHIHKATLIYTRNTNGRKLLLKAKLQAVKRSSRKITRKHVIWE